MAGVGAALRAATPRHRFTGALWKRSRAKDGSHAIGRENGEAVAAYGGLERR